MKVPPCRLAANRRREHRYDRSAADGNYSPIVIRNFATIWPGWTLGTILTEYHNC
jgi:hypothetical protein